MTTSPKSYLRLVLTGAVILALSTTLLTARSADPAQVKQLRETGSCENCDLRDAELGGVNAELGNLKNSDLRGAMLYAAVLRRADLTGALLAFANLKGADLRDARGVNLEGAITNFNTTCPDGSKGPCQ